MLVSVFEYLAFIGLRRTSPDNATKSQYGVECMTCRIELYAPVINISKFLIRAKYVHQFF